MQAQNIIADILHELKVAKKKHPNWPDHVVAQAAIVGEEAGELLQAALQAKYEPNSKEPSEHLEHMRKEAIQTAAMAIRFILNLNSK